MSSTLGDVFPGEIARLEELVAAYRQIGPVGLFALSHIEPVLKAAKTAWQEQDTVAMIRLYPEMRGKQ